MKIHQTRNRTSAEATVGEGGAQDKEGGLAAKRAGSVKGASGTSKDQKKAKVKDESRRLTQDDIWKRHPKYEEHKRKAEQMLAESGPILSVSPEGKIVVNNAPGPDVTVGDGSREAAARWFEKYRSTR